MTLLVVSLFITYPYDMLTPDALTKRAEAARTAGYELKSFEVERLPLKERVTKALLADNFDELERLAASMRKKKPRAYMGRPKLAVFYNALAPDHREVEAEVLEAHRKHLDTWLQKRPKSVTALVARAHLHGRFGWLARGGGWGNEVTEDGYTDFKSEIRKKYDLLNKAATLQPRDPEVYSALIIAAKDLGLPRNAADDYLKKGLTIDHTYDGLYIAMANFVLPKWGGERGDLLRIAEFAASTVPAHLKAYMFAKVAWVGKRSNPTLYGQYGIPWEKLREGIDAWLGKYPDSSYVSHFLAWAACAYRDRQTAKAVFPKLRYGLDGDSKYNWGKKPKYFDRCRAWASGTGRRARVTPAEPTSWCGKGDKPGLIEDALEYCSVMAPSSTPLASRYSLTLKTDDRPGFAGGLIINLQPTTELDYSGCMLHQLPVLIHVDPGSGRCEVAVEFLETPVK